MSASSHGWRVRLGAGLLVAALALFGAHYLIFRDFHHLAIYTLHDIAFLPVEVLLVTMILHELLERRARQERIHKLHMVIGAFFSEVGSELLRRIAAFDAGGSAGGAGREALLVRADWDARRFAAARAAAAAVPWSVDAARGDLVPLRAFLVEKRDFVLRLLENPNLLEHESFTDALWGVFHLAEELELRTDLAQLSRSDLAHLSGDMRRALAALAVEWLGHVRHLKDAYPYLFSLAVRRSPLDPAARVEIPDEPN